LNRGGAWKERECRGKRREKDMKLAPKDILVASKKRGHTPPCVQPDEKKEVQKELGGSLEKRRLIESPKNEKTLTSHKRKGKRYFPEFWWAEEETTKITEFY